MSSASRILTPPVTLVESLQDLHALGDYLVAEYGLPPKYRRIGMVWDHKLDQKNKKDPRAFCYVRDGSFLIYATGALDFVGPECRLGILLHEIGHLWLFETKGAHQEYEVDWWAAQVPESGYHYGSHEYWSPLRGEWVRAEPIELVKKSFVDEVLR
jgi:hypothetical protein